MKLVLSALYRDHAAMVARLIRRLSGDAADVEDLLHETFVIAQRRLDRYDGGCAPSTWLCGIAVNVCRARRRRLGRWRRVAERLPFEATAEVTAPDRLLQRGQQAALVHALLARLSDDEREVLVLHQLEGLGGEEIAAILALPIGTVWTRLRRARRRFADELERRGGHAVVDLRALAVPAAAGWSWRATAVAVSSLAVAAVLAVVSTDPRLEATAGWNAAGTGRVAVLDGEVSEVTAAAAVVDAEPIAPPSSEQATTTAPAASPRSTSAGARWSFAPPAPRRRRADAPVADATPGAWSSAGAASRATGSRGGGRRGRRAPADEDAPRGRDDDDDDEQPDVDDATRVAGHYDLLYLSRADDGMTLAAGAVDGRHTTLVTSSDAVRILGDVALSPAGDQVAYSTFDRDGAHALVILDLASGVSRALPTAVESAPAWSPDGSALAYVDASGLAIELRALDLASGASSRLASFELRASMRACVSPRWSPDGSAIVFAADARVDVVDLASGAIRTIARAVATCVPRWTPDGASIAYAWWDWDSDAAGLAVVPAAGGASQPLIATTRVRALEWSPTDDALAFVDHAAQVGNRLRLVAPSGEACTLALLEGSPGDPSWSPDGAALLFTSYVEGIGPQLKTVEIADGLVTELGLTPFSLEGAFPSWLPTPLTLGEDAGSAVE